MKTCLQIKQTGQKNGHDNARNNDLRKNEL
jgi:hypothetical protein